MDKNTIKQFQDIIGKFASAKIMTQDDIQQILEGIMKIMNTFKKGNETLNTDTTKTVDDLYTKTKKIQGEIIAMKDGFISDNSKTKEDLISQTDKKLIEMKALFDDFLLLRPDDGKDADNELIINEVLQQMEFPEEKEIEMDTGADIIKKINEDPDSQIDANKIKNLPKGTREIIREVGGRSGAYETPLVDSTGKAIPKDAFGRYVIPDQSGGGGFTYINEIVGGAGTAFTLAHVPVDGSKVALYGGGSRLTPGAGNDYTISGASITMTNSYSTGQVLADYS